MIENQQGPRPVAAEQRHVVIDVIRGFAVLGIFVFNMFSFRGDPGVFSMDWPDAIDNAVVFLTNFLIQAKFYSMFSFLFGWGMAIWWARAARHGSKANRIWLRRLLVLLLFGVVHGVLIWPGDILATYAILGFALWAFFRRSDRTLLRTIGLLLLFALLWRLPLLEPVRIWLDGALQPLRLTAPEELGYADGTFWSITQHRLADFVNLQLGLISYGPQVLSMMLLGLYVGRGQRLVNASRSGLRKMLLWGLLVGVPLNLAFAVAAMWSSQGQSIPVWWPAAWGSFIIAGLRTIGAPALMLAYVAGLSLAFRSRRWQEPLSSLATVGRAALSNYLLQSVIGTLIFYNYGLGIYGELGPTFGLLLTLIIFAAQVRLSGWWFKGHKFGPAEYLWRSLTYWRRQPWGRYETYENLPPLRLARAWRASWSFRLLVLVWLLIFFWGLGLNFWYADLQARIPAEPGVNVGSFEAQTLATSVAADMRFQPTLEPASTPEPPPQTVAVERQPRSLVAASNWIALAGAFDVEAALAYIDELAAPRFEGRYAGSPGGIAAGDYIAAQFEQLGLQPAGNGGTYFQAFPIPYDELAQPPSFTVTLPDGTVRDDYSLASDYRLLVHTYLGEGEASGQVIWANNCAESDLAQVDVVEKIAFCRAVDTIEAGRYAMEAGASGLLLLLGENDDSIRYGTTYRDVWVPEPIPALLISNDVAADLLTGSDFSVSNLSLIYDSFALQTEASFSIDMAGPAACPAAGCQGRNVLGVLPGSDPALADEIIIVGGHYDHLGATPDGQVWAGANDNASGIGVMLALAATWQEQGFVPRRTILFVAWDAEELGLLGSSYYVQHPRYPLMNTVAFLNMDMVGSGGDLLRIDGEGIDDDLLDIAASLNVSATIQTIGRSDHVPFIEAGVPASLVIWLGEETDTHYHQVGDTMAVIQPAKVEVIGQLVGLAALSLSEAESELDAFLARRAEAVLQGDTAAFQQTNGPGYENNLWYDDLRQRQPSEVTLDASEVRLTATGAIALVRMNAAWQDDEGEREAASAETVVQFVWSDGAWRWQGSPGMTGAQDGSPAVEVWLSQERAAEAAPLARSISNRIASLWEQFGLTPPQNTQVYFYSGSQALRADAGLTLPTDTNALVAPGEVSLTYAEGITTSQRLADSLLELMVSNAGIPRTPESEWLWAGLAQVMSYADTIAAQYDNLPLLADAWANGEEADASAAAWARVELLRQSLGWEGLGAFITQAGNQGLDAALRQAIGEDNAGFATAWESEWQERLEAVQAAADGVLSRRVAAVQTNDVAAFLDTVDGETPLLAADQSAWFETIQQKGITDQPEALEMSALPLALLPDGSFVAEISTTYAWADETTDTTTAPVMFRQVDGAWVWAGEPYEMIGENNLVLLAPPASTEDSAEWLATVEAALAAVDASLGITSVQTVTVRLFQETDSFEYSVSPDFQVMPWVGGFTAPGQSVRVLLGSNTWDDLVTQLVRQRLHQQGASNEWLLKGAIGHVATLTGNERATLVYRDTLSNFWAQVGRDEPPEWTTLLPDYQMSAEQWALAMTQAGDMMRYVSVAYGRETLAELLRTPGESVADVLSASLNQTPEAFAGAWITSLGQAHVSDEELAIAAQFDVEAALDRISVLTGPAFAGRQAGSEGAAAAADYIAEQFSLLGLQAPAGMLDYRQTFTIEYASLWNAPSVTFAMPDGSEHLLSYRQDFVTVFNELPAGGFASGELVLISGDNYENQDLSGKIVVRRGFEVAQLEIERALAHRAVGLILVQDTAFTQEGARLSKSPLPISFPADEESLPVVALTGSGFDLLMQGAGITLASLEQAPPALMLGIEATLHVPLTTPEVRESANVVGIWPGSDPVLRDEVVLVGAHYDHVGNDPALVLCQGQPARTPESIDSDNCQQIPGLAYSGINDNASGVAIMLEIIRLWRDSGYQPERTVMFVAWGVQEAGEIGAHYYVQNPVLPLTRTMGVFHLDGLGGGEGFRLSAEGYWETDGELIYSLSRAPDYLEGRLQLTTPIESRPIVPFRSANIPTVLLSWNDADESNLPDSIGDVIDPLRVRTSGQMISMALMSAAR